MSASPSAASSRNEDPGQIRSRSRSHRRVLQIALRCRLRHPSRGPLWETRSGTPPCRAPAFPTRLPSGHAERVRALGGHRVPPAPAPAAGRSGGARILPPVRHAAAHAAAASDWCGAWPASPGPAPRGWPGRAGRGGGGGGPAHLSVTGAARRAGGARWLPRRSLARVRSLSPPVGKSGPPERPPPPPRRDLLPGPLPARSLPSTLLRVLRGPASGPESPRGGAGGRCHHVKEDFAAGKRVKSSFRQHVSGRARARGGGRRGRLPSLGPAAREALRPRPPAPGSGRGRQRGRVGRAPGPASVTPRARARRPAPARGCQCPGAAGREGVAPARSSRTREWQAGRQCACPGRGVPAAAGRAWGRPVGGGGRLA